MNLVFNEQSIVLAKDENGSYLVPRLEQLEAINYQPSLLKAAQVELLAYLENKDVITLISGLELVNLRLAFSLLPVDEVKTIIYAQQLVHYERTNRFCGGCGNATCLTAEYKWLYCNTCQREIYPRIAPAMIVAVVKEDKLLMAQANNFAPGVWSVLAGFSEIGESLEETVRREVMEEVGISVTNIRYWGSQYWPFPNSLMVGFIADYAGGEIVIDPSEIRAAGFFGKDELPGRPSTRLSIASQMIDAVCSRL